jgi:quercetin dioxygenase-like cupin family protein
VTVSPQSVSSGELLHRPATTGPAFWGPGDHYTFLVTGEESGGAYFAMEALVPPGGGPPPHIHTREEETFYILGGRLEILLGDELVLAGPGDFVNVPRGVVHRFLNIGTEAARVLITFTPAGIDRWFLQTLDAAPNDVAADDVPDNVEEVGARYAATAADYGIEFV